MNYILIWAIFPGYLSLSEGIPPYLHKYCGGWEILQLAQFVYTQYEPPFRCPFEFLWQQWALAAPVHLCAAFAWWDGNVAGRMRFLRRTCGSCDKLWQRIHGLMKGWIYRNPCVSCEKHRTIMKHNGFRPRFSLNPLDGSSTANSNGKFKDLQGVEFKYSML